MNDTHPTPDPQPLTPDRLREIRAWRERPNWCMSGPEVMDLVDEIDRQASELTTLRQDLETLRQERNRQRLEVQRAVRAERARVEAENARLRQALERLASAMPMGDDARSAESDLHGRLRFARAAVAEAQEG